jgi:hypothetical protein
VGSGIDKIDCVNVVYIIYGSGDDIVPTALDHMGVWRDCEQSMLAVYTANGKWEGCIAVVNSTPAIVNSIIW